MPPKKFKPNRSLRLEGLEDRKLMTVDTTMLGGNLYSALETHEAVQAIYSTPKPAIPNRDGQFLLVTSEMTADLNGDGRVTPADALTCINRLQAQESGQPSHQSSPLPDVNSDGLFDKRDLENVLNEILQKQPRATDVVYASSTNAEHHKVSGGALEASPMAVETFEGVSYVNSAQFNSRSEYELRPTLLVLTHGASFDKTFQNGAGYTEDDGWTWSLANNLAYDLNQAGSQVHVMRVDWASQANNTSQAREVGDHIRDFLSQRIAEWDVVLVGHSRGAIFNQEVAHELGTPGNLVSLQHVMLDPTAAVSMGDDYPSSVPGNVDRAVVYDDGYQLFPATLVRDGIAVAGAENRRVSVPGSNYINSHEKLANAYADDWYKRDLGWKINQNHHDGTVFATESGVGYETVVTRSPDDANKVIDIGFDPNRNGDAHAFISVLGLGGGDLTIGKSGLAVGGGITFMSGGAFSVNKDRFAINYSRNLGPVSTGVGLNITSEETRLDLDAGPLRISMFGKGAGIYFGGNKISIAESLQDGADSVSYEQISNSGESIKQTFLSGVETLREQIFTDGRKVVTRLIGGVSKVTEWLSVPSDPAELAGILRQLSPADLASAISGLPVEKLAATVRHLGDTTRQVLSALSANTVAGVLNKLDAKTLTAALDTMSVARVAEVLQNVNVPTLDSALHRLSNSRVAHVLEKVNGETLRQAIKQLDVDRAAAILDKVNDGTLKEAFKRMSTSLAANVLEKVNVSTLKGVLGKIDLDRGAEILEKVDGDTLKEALKNVSISRAADILERVDSSTLKAALKRLSTDTIADVLNKVDSKTLKHALDAIDANKLKSVLKDASTQVITSAEKYLKKADPGKLSSALKSVASGVSGVAKKIGF